MKRFGTLILALCLFLALLSIPSFADGTSYYLEELDMSISIPEGFDVFTRDTKPSDANARKYGMTQEDLDSIFENNVYIYAWDNAKQYEFIITSVESPFNDLNLLNDDLIKSLANSMREDFESMDVTFIKSDIYKHDQIKFLKMYISQYMNAEKVYSLMHTTILNGSTINFTLHSYSGQIGSSEEALAKEIVDSAVFDYSPLSGAPASESPAFIYTDEESGLRFTVPANWIEEEVSEDSEYIDTKFVSTFSDGSIIIFASEDIYESETDFRKGLVSRDMFGNDLISKELVAEMCLCDESDVFLYNLGDKEYYFAELNFTDSVYGLDLTSKITFLLRCENGILYMFQFYGGSDSAYYDDFVQLVGSCEYPQFDISEADTEAKYLLIGLIVLAVLLLTPAIYPLPIIIYRFAIRKKPLSKKRARIVALIYGLCFAAIPAFIALLTIGIFWLLAAVLIVMIAVNYAILKCGKAKEKTTPIDAVIFAIEDPTIEKVYEVPLQSDFPANSSRLQYCHMCGNKLAEDTAYCSKCGTKIGR